MSRTKSAHVFKTNLRGTWAEVQDKAVAIVNGVTFRLYEFIVDGTRVDTGRMRAGWSIAVESAGGYTPAVGTHPRPSSDGFVAELEGAPLEAKRIIFNNVEYVVWWEFGTDRFEGDHMVRIAIQRLVAGG